MVTKNKAEGREGENCDYKDSTRDLCDDGIDLYLD